MLLSDRFAALDAEGKQKPRSEEAEALREQIWQDIKKKTDPDGKATKGQADKDAKK
jgi:hypothetical protein